MEPVTILIYEDETGEHRKRVNWFNSDTPIEEFYQRITDEMGMKSFELEIKDSYGGFVDFDKDYRKDFRPYVMNLGTGNAGAQSTTVPVQIVELKIVNIPRHDSTADDQRKSKKNSSNTPRQLAESDSVTDQPQSERECASSRTDLPYESAPSSVTLHKREPAMKFIRDLNKTLRTPFKSEKRIQIQGDKTGLTKKAQHRSVPPEFKMRKGTVSEENKSTCNVVYVLVQEVCDDGTRTCYYHPEKQLVTDENKSASPTKRNKTRQGIELKAERISHTEVNTKDHLDQQKHVFCSLQDQYPKGTNYKTTRLAVLLERDGRLSWDELVLSKATIFCKSSNNVEYIIIKDNDGETIEQIPEVKKGRKTKSNQSDTNTSQSKKFKSSNTQTLPVTTTMNSIQQHDDNRRVVIAQVLLNNSGMELTITQITQTDNLLQEFSQNSPVNAFDQEFQQLSADTLSTFLISGDNQG